MRISLKLMVVALVGALLTRGATALASPKFMDDPVWQQQQAVIQQLQTAMEDHRTETGSYPVSRFQLVRWLEVRKDKPLRDLILSMALTSDIYGHESGTMAYYIMYKPNSTLVQGYWLNLNVPGWKSSCSFSIDNTGPPYEGKEVTMVDTVTGTLTASNRWGTVQEELDRTN